MHIHHQNMHNYIGNMLCVVFINVQILIFQIQNQTRKIKMLSQSYVFISIKKFYIVLWMLDTLAMKRNSVNYVRLLHMQSLLQKSIPEKSLSWWSHQLWTLIKTYKFLQFRSLHYTYHMYALLERITVATHAERNSSVVQLSNMCCDIGIMNNM